MSHLQVAVLRGGPSEEYAVSLWTGETVLKALSELGYNIKDIVITKQGEWLERGRSRRPESILATVDVVFVALHGAYGEDGEVQKILQRLHIPFTGSRSFPSAVAFNKTLTKNTLAQKGVVMPAYREVSYNEKEEIVTISKTIADSFGPEYIIKPVASGSSLGTSLVRPGQSLAAALDAALEQHERVLVEEFIRGQEATVAVLEDFRNEKIYTFPAVEIIPSLEAPFFDNAAKYNGQTNEICPARFSYPHRSALADIASDVHELLDLSQYSRSDFIVSPRGIYFLEVNTLPGLTPQSLYPKATASVGLNINQLIDHLVESATC